MVGSEFSFKNTRCHLSRTFILCLIFSFPAWAEQKIEWVQTSPQIYVNQAIQVTVTAKVSPDADLIPQSVTLFKIQDNSQLENQGLLYDDGTHGDATAGDNIFTTQININENKANFLHFQISAAYKKSIKRLTFDFLVPVKIEGDAESTKAAIVAYLRSGNIEAAAASFRSGKKNDFLRTLNREAQNQLATWIESAQLSNGATNEFRCYESIWQDDQGVTHKMKFIMLRNNLGEWKINNW
jgi:hypothetical protein